MTATEFKNIILPRYGIMLNMANYILKDKDMAYDAVQDVMKQLWEHHGELAVPSNPSSYVLRCVRNRCIDILKQQRDVTSIDESDFQSSDDENDELYMERLGAIDESISKLKEPSKSVLLLNLKNVPIAEISALTGLSEVNIRQILSRTRRRLKNIIEQTKKRI